jgi:hypothetical protein
MIIIFVDTGSSIPGREGSSLPAQPSLASEMKKDYSRGLFWLFIHGGDIMADDDTPIS